MNARNTRPRTIARVLDMPCPDCGERPVNHRIKHIAGCSRSALGIDGTRRLRLISAIDPEEKVGPDEARALLTRIADRLASGDEALRAEVVRLVHASFCKSNTNDEKPVADRPQVSSASNDADDDIELAQ